MREFRTSCIDNETGMEIYLSECSYNRAADWLTSKGFTNYDKFECDGKYITMHFTKPTKRTFMYDEDRGVLLADYLAPLF